MLSCYEGPCSWRTAAVWHIEFALARFPVHFLIINRINSERGPKACGRNPYSVPQFCDITAVVGVASS